MKLHVLGEALARKSHTVRVRLTLWNIGVLALALAGFAVIVRYTVQANLAASVDRDLAQTAEHRAQRFSHLSANDLMSLSVGRPNGDPRSVDHPANGAGNYSPQWVLPAAITTRPGLSFAAGLLPAPSDIRSDLRRPRLFTVTGRPLPGPLADQPWDIKGLRLAAIGQGLYSTIEVDREPVRIYSTPVIGNGGIIAVMQLARPLSDLRSLLNELTRVLLLLIPVVLALAGTGGAFLTGRAIRPVRQVIQAARHITAEDLSMRLPVAGDDEFSELAATFNGMVGRLQGAFTRLEEAFAQQHRFTGDASHELRTPLTTIRAETSLALMGERTPEEYRQALRTADHAAEMMSRIVQDMLLVARSDAGQINIQERPLPIGPVLQRAASAVQRGRPGAPIHIQDSDASLQVLGDSHHLQRLFVNFFENAVRHTPVDGRITAQAWAEGNQVRITVADTGEGIPPEHLPHVCERFYRVDASRTRSDGGTGLGLAICETIVHAHHGEMKIESKPGQGTTVTVTLPRALEMEQR